MTPHADELADSSRCELQCAQRVVAILFDETGLSKLIPGAPMVTVGAGNWISFWLDQPAPRRAVLELIGQSGATTFAPDALNRHGARSRTSPSLHLTNLDAGANLVGHVDAHYWGKNPIRHVWEFLTKKTMPPSDLLRTLRPAGSNLFAG
jgi:hypothetical protein